VVDDEPDLRTLYELTLLREGHQVRTAGTLAQARQCLAEQTFDAVITDMRLPDGDGWPCCATWRPASGASAAS
jgi:two-component system response regulator PilR (NtrC family)